MGGNLSSEEKLTDILINHPDYLKLHSRAQQLNLSITIQGDGSLYVQNLNQLKQFRRISAPVNREDIPLLLGELKIILDEMSQNSGNVHYGYQ